MDQRTYWSGRWERGETGWHQKEVEPELVSFFKNIAPTRVFVPLCGKSLDMVWLSSQGFEVIGVEFSESACRNFFLEQKITPQEKDEGAFKVFTAGKVKIFCGDFFNISPDLIGKLGALYDRAALIALPPDIRHKYVSHVTSIVKSCRVEKNFHFLQIILDREPHDQKGPPFSIPPREFETYYKDNFEFKLIKREQLEMDDAPHKSFQSVYHLTI